MIELILMLTLCFGALGVYYVWQRLEELEERTKK
jgi:hypothetical protein